MIQGRCLCPQLTFDAGADGPPPTPRFIRATWLLVSGCSQVGRVRSGHLLSSPSFIQEGHLSTESSASCASCFNCPLCFGLPSSRLYLSLIRPCLSSLHLSTLRSKSEFRNTSKLDPISLYCGPKPYVSTRISTELTLPGALKPAEGRLPRTRSPINLRSSILNSRPSWRPA